MTDPADTEGIISFLTSGGNCVTQNADAKIYTALKLSRRAVDIWVRPNRWLVERDLADAVNRSRFVELDNSTIQTVPVLNIFAGSKNGC